MLEAETYNRFLTECVERFAGEATSILDFGAGMGTFAERVRSRGRPLDCLEPDRSLASILETRNFTTFRRSEDIATASYDYVYSLNVFEHIEDDRAAAREVCRILRPGGALFIYVPAFQILFGSMDRKVEHFRRYTRQSLARLVREAGLEIETLSYADSLGFFATLAYNLTASGDGSINTRSIRFYDRYVFPLSRQIDRATSGLLGKNVFVVARKPATALPPSSGA
ncbi:methyltransferase domain-containing protein [Aquicoccus sp. SCR17]|nr:methyltransferase domain-containing protein [Carideicomes alvinocaridis]